jgi:hypothetical protein
VKWGGGDAYIHGANLPWYNYGRDFGGGTTDGGVSSPAVAAAVGMALASAHAAGMNVVRWWLFPGVVTQFSTDGAGLPTGIKPTVYQDIDAALALARANGISYVFTLFSAPTALPAAWVATADGRQRLADVLGPLFARYATNPGVMTWDVVNEPDAAVINGNAQSDVVRALIKAIAASAHANSTTPVTVGGFRLDGLPLFTGLGLDYYTVHWYDPMTAPGQCLACVTYAEIRDAIHLDKPIVVGEFNAPPDTVNRFQLFHDRGYAGALAWSLLPDRTTDHLSIDMDAAYVFAQTLASSH